jgi:hypothetical protein
MKKFNYNYVEKGTLLKVKAITPGNGAFYSYPLIVIILEKLLSKMIILSQ